MKRIFDEELQDNHRQALVQDLINESSRDIDAARGLVCPECGSRKVAPVWPRQYQCERCNHCWGFSGPSSIPYGF